MSRSLPRLGRDTRRGAAGPSARSLAFVLRPSHAMRDRIAERVASDRGGHPLAARSRARAPEWRPVASGIRCKGLATDVERKRVSMLVRLAPNTEYALHRQGGVEALLRLEGVLFVDERTLHPGDHLRSGSKRATRASSARPDAPACS